MPIASDNAVVCDQLTRFTRPTHFQTWDAAALCTALLRMHCFFFIVIRSASFQPSTNSAAIGLTISTGLSAFVSTWNRFHAPSTPDCRASDSLIMPVTLTHSKGLPLRHHPSLTDRNGLFLRAVIPWRDHVGFAQGCMGAQTTTTAHQPPRHAACTQPRLLTSPLVPITTGRYRDCALRLTSMVAIGRPLQGCHRHLASNTLVHPHDPRFTSVTADRQGFGPIIAREL